MAGPSTDSFSGSTPANPASKPGSPSTGYYLTVHGPNDGEPLNQHCPYSRVGGQVPLRLETNFHGSGIILIFRGELFVAYLRPDFSSRSGSPGGQVLPFLGGGDAEIELTYLLDTTCLPDGHHVLSLFLMPPTPDRVMATARWQMIVSNPQIKLASPGPEPGIGNALSSSKVKLQLEGRPGDGEFLLISAGEAESLAELPTSGKQDGALTGTQIVAAGMFDLWRQESSDGQAPSAASHSPQREIDLNLDALYKFHKTDPQLALWTRPSSSGSISSKWARSRIIDLKTFLAASKADGSPTPPAVNPTKAQAYTDAFKTSP